MAKGGGGGGSPQSSTQTSQPHPFAFSAVQDYLDQAREVSSRGYQPYTGQRVADLTPTHQAALDYGRGAMGSTLPMAQSIMSQFATGQHNQPAYIHPFLSGGVGAAAPNNFFYPFPWGNTGYGEAGGEPAAGSGSPASAPSPSSIPAGAVPQTVAPPAGLSAMGGFGSGSAAAATEAPESMWGRGSPNSPLIAETNRPLMDNLASDAAWNAYLGIPYGTGQGDYVSPMSMNPGMRHLNYADKPSQQELQQLLYDQEQGVGGEN